MPGRSLLRPPPRIAAASLLYVPSSTAHAPPPRSAQVRNRWGRLKERDTADAGLGGEGAAGWDHASQEAPSRGMATASDVPAPASDADPVEVRSTVSRAKKGAPILKATAPAAAHGRNLRKRLR